MYYEITVSQNGKHLFATAPRSLTHEERANEVYAMICERFPTVGGFKVTMTLWRNSGEAIKDSSNE